MSKCVHMKTCVDTCVCMGELYTQVSVHMNNCICRCVCTGGCICVCAHWGSVYVRVRARVYGRISLGLPLPEPPLFSIPIFYSLRTCTPVSLRVSVLVCLLPVCCALSLSLCLSQSESLSFPKSLRFSLLISASLGLHHISRPLPLSSVVKSLEHWLTPSPSSASPWSPHPSLPLSPTCVPSLARSPLIPPFQAKGRESGPDWLPLSLQHPPSSPSLKNSRRNWDGRLGGEGGAWPEKG